MISVWSDSRKRRQASKSTRTKMKSASPAGISYLTLVQADATQVQLEAEAQEGPTALGDVSGLHSADSGASDTNRRHLALVDWRRRNGPRLVGPGSGGWSLGRPRRRKLDSGRTLHRAAPDRPQPLARRLEVAWAGAENRHRRNGATTWAMTSSPARSPSILLNPRRALARLLRTRRSAAAGSFAQPRRGPGGGREFGTSVFRPGQER